MPTRLTDMVYDEVAFVDRGANNDDVEGAHIVLFKRDGSEDKVELDSIDIAFAKAFADQLDDAGNSTEEMDGQGELFVYTSDEGTPNDDSAVGKHTQEGDEMPDTGQIDKSALSPEALAYVEGIEKALAEKTAEVETLQKKDTTEEVDIFKGMSPEAVEVFKKMQSDNEANAERIAKMENEKELAGYTSIAKSFTSLSVDEEKTPAALMVLAKADKDGAAYAEIVRMLKSADEVLKSSRLFKAVGTDSRGSGSQEEKVSKRAEEIAKAESIPLHTARAKAWEEVAATGGYDEIVSGRGE